MAYPDYSTGRFFYGHPLLACSRQHHSADEDPIYRGDRARLFANCRMGTVFWQPDDFLMAVIQSFWSN